MNPTEAQLICIRNNILVYPIIIKYNQWRIRVDKNGIKLVVYDKILTTKDQVNKAMISTYIHFANKLK